MGGSGNYPRQARTVGIPLVATIVSFILGIHNPYVLFLSMGLLVASIATYWDWMFKDVDNFWMHGFMCGLSALPIAYITGNWEMFAVRCLILAIWSGVWSLIWKWDIAEESGRLLPLIPTLLLIV
jgi:uncharacterized membrane protein